MAKSDKLRIRILLCPNCKLPLPFEDYDGRGMYIGKCEICQNEYEARLADENTKKYKIREKRRNTEI